MLTAYNGTPITYDEIGNRLTDGTWTYTWEHGRELSSMTDGTTTWNYTYDANGLRTKRTNGNYTYEYIYDGNGKLVFMQYHHYKMYFTYDPISGAPLSVYYDDGLHEQYNLCYITNTRGDVLGMAREDGSVVVSYDYDAWGNLIHYEDSTAFGTGDINPLRYRGYVYDRETGLYYLQSRYYDPEIGRFINADDLVATGKTVLGNNMFTYCYNNAVNMADYEGKDAVFVVLTNFDEGGLPIVGHAAVYIQDSRGKWYFTEYTGTFPDKSTAKVKIKNIDSSQIEETLASSSSVYIEGDFSASVDLAQTYAGGNYNGYNFLENNCLDYTREILNAGTFKSKMVKTVVKNHYTPVPVEFGRSLAKTTLVVQVIEGVKSIANKLWTAIKKWW